ncbi:uncharacterized protein MEPE_01162 [Melanopsichium pennsylvanicum]|uniref:DUF159-domain-containing protein n=2 Tax=Melanopsichium pennsylvanicum TaxID=63383 RepID=A0AAJ5C3B8_9BASI|nr:conserved hypothetical protein [Melanopsichium pennsylvanicum 4]SNX82456.1 uncharacterized protein MEPE_01162 [Melanopsichium pennsylvanicum]
MCGRFANAQPIPQYRSAVREQLPPHHPAPQPSPDADDYTPSHNVAPQTRCPVVRRELSWERERRFRSIKSPTDAERQHRLIIQTMKWGLVPRFHKNPPSYGEAYKTINARDDTILSPQRSMWHSLLPAQRCVVFVQGFYEWQKKGDGDKVERIPHFVGMREPGHGREDKTGHGRRLMPLAGLWERVRFENEDKPLYTFTIVTTASNHQLGFLHDRMPVILPTDEAISTWLGLNAEPKSEKQVKEGGNMDDTWSTEVAKLLRPLQGELECYKVPKEVGKVGNNDSSFILPVEERRDGLKALFNKQKQQPMAKGRQSDPTVVADSSGSVKAEGLDQSTQASDELMPSSSEDAQALLAAQRAEEEAALAEATAKAEQEEADRKMAQEMQRELERSEANQQPDGADMSRSESIVNIRESSESELTQVSSEDSIKTTRQDDEDDVAGEEVGDGFAVPEDEGMPSDDADFCTARKRAASSSSDDKLTKRTRTSSTSLSSPSAASSIRTPPSSRFSPDPYNPPQSPPRPKGGYSRKLSPASGGGVHVNPPRGKNRGKPRFEPFPQAPAHTWKSPTKKEKGPMDEMLEKQRRAAERLQEEESRAWRELSPSRNTGGGGTGGKKSESTVRASKSPNGKKTVAIADKAGKAAGTDIRTFFSPQKKK